MNKKITTLYIITDPVDFKKKFRVFFPPDPGFEYFNVGQEFTVASVNRQTGEIQFTSELDNIPVPEDDSSND